MVSIFAKFIVVFAMAVSAPAFANSIATQLETLDAPYLANGFVSLGSGYGSNYAGLNGVFGSDYDNFTITSASSNAFFDSRPGFAVLSGRSVTLAIGKKLDSFFVKLNSPDPYNLIIINFTDGFSANLPGSAVFNPYNGNQSAAFSILGSFFPSQPIKSITFASFGPNSFEIGEVGVKFTAPAPGAVPEPGTWVMLIIGFGLTGAIARRRQKVAIGLT